jgi:hypothetical protein
LNRRTIVLKKKQIAEKKSRYQSSTGSEKEGEKEGNESERGGGIFKQSSREI